LRQFPSIQKRRGTSAAGPAFLAEFRQSKPSDLADIHLKHFVKPIPLTILLAFHVGAS
jgi:hypothetical protein